jgi:hypothetical protein
LDGDEPGQPQYQRLSGDRRISQQNLQRSDRLWRGADLLRDRHTRGDDHPDDLWPQRGGKYAAKYIVFLSDGDANNNDGNMPKGLASATRALARLSTRAAAGTSTSATWDPPVGRQRLPFAREPELTSVNQIFQSIGNVVASGKGITTNLGTCRI